MLIKNHEKPLMNFRVNGLKYGQCKSINNKTFVKLHNVSNIQTTNCPFFE